MEPNNNPDQNSYTPPDTLTSAPTEPISHNEPIAMPSPPEEEKAPSASNPIFGQVITQPDNTATVSQDASGPVVGTNLLASQSHPSLLKRLTKRWKLTLAIFGGVLLLGGGLTAAYVGIVLPNQPNNIVAQALGNLLSANSLETKFNVMASGGQNPQFSMFGTVAANTDGVFTMNGTLDLAVTRVNVEVLSPDGKNLYVKVNDLSDISTLLGNLSLGPEQSKGIVSALNTLNDQWILIDQNLLRGALRTHNSLTLNGADKQKIGDLYVQHEFIQVKQTLADASINGVNNYHYRLTIDKTQLRAFLQSLKNTHLSTVTITDKDIDHIVATNFNDSTYDLWVAKATKTIDQLKVVGKNSESTVTLTFDNYNKPVHVVAPANAKSVLSVINTFLSSLGGGHVTQDNINQFFSGITVDSTPAFSL